MSEGELHSLEALVREVLLISLVASAPIFFCALLAGWAAQALLFSARVEGSFLPMIARLLGGALGLLLFYPWVTRPVVAFAERAFGWGP